MLRSKADKRARLLLAKERLAERYPSAECALEYGGDPWRLLVMARLSAQCTDARVNIVSRELFEKYPNAEALAAANVSEVEDIVRPCGLYRMKAESIVSASRAVVERFSGRVPDTMDELLSLSGVGRKIANLVLGDVYGKPAMVCDTHCIRILGRLGIYKESLKDAEKIEFIIRDLIDVSDGSELCHRIVTFGRDICTARSPRCSECPMKSDCEHVRSALK